jgi:succinate-semialdehyde dehydrogenase/glutarate-semialdehyde dehydrogenase
MRHHHALELPERHDHPQGGSCARAAGCTVVIKPSDFTPYSALVLAVLAERAGIPAGAINIVTGLPAEIGAEIMANETVRKILFTGSTRVGSLLMHGAADSVKRVSLELGGNAPFIVFDDADLELAVEGAIMSKFRNGGQTCVCANRILVQAGVMMPSRRSLSPVSRECRWDQVSSRVWRLDR